MEKKINYTATDRTITALLKDGAQLTLAEMNATGATLVSGHIVSAMKKGLIEVVGEKEIVKPAKRKVAVYTYIGTANLPEKTKLTEKETELVAFMNTDGLESTFTLAGLATRLGRKITSGNINGLVKKGVVKKSGETEVSTTRKSKVKVYGWVADPIE